VLPLGRRYFFEAFFTGALRVRADARAAGFDAVANISYVTHRSEDTRCYFCKNKCMRTFIDVQIASADESWKKSKVPIPQGVKRLIVGNSCEKGLVEDVNDMREIKKGLDAMNRDNPNMAEVAAKAGNPMTSPTA